MFSLQTCCNLDYPKVFINLGAIQKTSGFGMALKNPIRQASRAEWWLLPGCGRQVLWSPAVIVPVLPVASVQSLYIAA